MSAIVRQADPNQSKVVINSQPTENPSKITISQTIPTIK